MKLQVVKYNSHYKINKILLYLLYIMLVITGIMQDKFCYVFLWLSLFMALVSIIYSEVFEVYTIIGKCSIDLHSICLKYTNNLEYIEFSEILFIHGGYKGKDNGFTEIFSGSNIKSGVNNYLVFGKNTAIKIQIMLNSQKEYKDLLNKLAELEASGIKVQINNKM